MRRVLRITFKIGVIAAIGVGIAVVVKKLTAPPEDTTSSLEPWPPLSTDTPATSPVVESTEAVEGSGSTGELTGTAEEAADEAAAEVVAEAEAAVEEASGS